MTFQPGDVVRKKGTTVNMTAGKTWDVRAGQGIKQTNRCTWFEGSKVCEKTFLVDELERVRPRVGPLPDPFWGLVRLASGGPDMERTYDGPRDFGNGSVVRILRCKWPAGRSEGQHDFTADELVLVGPLSGL